ncbi:MAG: hypothetical protein U0T07_09570 [Chitinophagales bacterium]
MKHIIYLIAITTLFTACKQSANNEATETTPVVVDTAVATVQRQTQITEQPSESVNVKEEAKNNADNFLGCWQWGEENEVYAILEVKPKGILIIHRLDLYEGKELKEDARYKIVNGKIVFTNNTLLMQTEYHIATIQNEIFLVEDYMGQKGNMFKKVKCNYN